jgi:murein L,D-transpeptidase YcbB/YkuD
VNKLQHPSRPTRRLVLAAAGALAACRGSPPQEAGLQLRPAQAKLLRRALAEAPSQGFLPGRFPAGPDDRSLANASMAYASALHGHSIAERDWPQDWDIRPQPYDAKADFGRALQTDQVEAWLAALPPDQERYRQLQAGLARYLTIVGAGGWRVLAAAPTPEELFQRLAVEDPALATDRDLPEAVRRAQARYGLEPTGKVDKATLESLNVPAQARAAQIRANLERLRWLPRTPAPTRIEVNSAANTFVLFINGAPALRMLAAAGRPGDETPMLVSAIESVVFNPPWNVPDTIARKELFPKAERDPGYFSREGFVTKDDGGQTRLMQQPGPKNALGQVKFEFPNPFQVYLHDTPAKAAFTRANRSVSHGCVRLERALDLARTLLSTAPDWSAERVEEVLQSDETTRVKLPRPTPVVLNYLTAFPDAGAIAFRQDIYGWDGRLLRLLDAPGSSLA